MICCYNKSPNLSNFILGRFCCFNNLPNHSNPILDWFCCFFKLPNQSNPILDSICHFSNCRDFYFLILCFSTLKMVARMTETCSSLLNIKTISLACVSLVIQFHYTFLCCNETFLEMLMYSSSIQATVDPKAGSKNVIRHLSPSFVFQQ